MIRADRIVGLVFIAVALAGAAMTLDWPTIRGLAFGPSFFPRIIFAMMFLGGLVLLLRRRPPYAGETVTGGIADPSTPDADPLVLPALFDDRPHVVFVLSVLAGLIVYVAFFEIVGFFILTAAFCLMVVCLSGGGLVGAAVFSVIFTAAMQWAFETLLKVPLPHGTLW